MNSEIRSQILLHAKQEYPKECCGLIYIKNGKEFYHPCKNISERSSQFSIDPRDFASIEAIGTILKIVHSHPNQNALPSSSDLTSCEITKLPWVIVSYPNGHFHEFSPSGYKAPLIGREFHYGVHDCFALVCDWYKEVKNIELPDYPEHEWEWWKKDQNIFEENIEAWGFKKVDKLEEPGDLILMQVRSKVANHLAIYLGNNIILHHCEGRLSSKDVYGGWFRKCTRFIVRYAK